MINEMVIIWLVVMIAAIVIEFVSLGLTSVWFAGGALIAALAALANLPLGIQIILFLLVSILLLVFTRPVAVKYFNRERIRTNVEGLVGKQAIVISEIDNLQGVGQVSVNGQEWSARNFADGKLLAPGTIVKIRAVNGVKLIVEEDPQNREASPRPSAEVSEAELDPRIIESRENGEMPNQE